MVNSFVVYGSDTLSQDISTEFSLKYCLFGSVELTKNADPNKYQHSDCGIGFDSRSIFPIPNFDCRKNAVTFGVDMSSSVHANNKTKIF